VPEWVSEGFKYLVMKKLKRLLFTACLVVMTCGAFQGLSAAGPGTGEGCGTCTVSSDVSKNTGVCKRCVGSTGDACVSAFFTVPACNGSGGVDA
jgi:hypothetical protein